MRFLIDADLPRSTVALLKRYRHEGLDVRDIGLGASSDADIAQHAQAHGLCLLTGDHDFADIRAYPPPQFQGIVVLYISPDATAPLLLALLEEFLKQTQVVNALAGKLAIVEPGRIRLRSAGQTSSHPSP
jgi:predicted nuclease of predicted toxin-antitoxin system